MKKKRNNRLLILLAVVVLAMIGGAVYKANQKPKGEKVEVELAEKRTIKEMVEASGKIFPETEVKISSDVSGEIVELYVEEGDSIVSGQLLAKIDPDAYQSAVERGVASVNNAKAQVATSKAGIARSDAQYTQAEAEVQRIEVQISNTRSIHQRNVQLHNDGVISLSDFEASETNLKSLEANLKAAKAALKTAEANLESSKQSTKASEFMVKSSEASLKEIKTSLRKTTIYAPTDGIVSKLNVKKGERVVGTIQMAGTELMRIANLNAMEVQVDVSETDVLRVAMNDDVEIEVDAYLDRKFKGKVYQIANSASNSSSAALTTDQVTNFIVKIRIDPASYADLISNDKPYPFRPGMSASVAVNTQTKNDVLTIPIQAVTTRDAEDLEKDKKDKKSKKKKKDKAAEEKILEIVFLHEGDSVKMVEVKTGIQDDDYIEILTGINEGTEIVIGPYSAVSRKLKDGDVVVIKTEEDEEEENED